MIVTMSVPVHVPVLLDEVIAGLQAQRGGYFVDCTVGLGGHATAILEKISPSGRLLGIDADPEAIKLSQDKLSDYGEAVTLVNDNFVNLEAICKRYHFHPVDGILFDLGVSSLQLDTAERGFSFHLDAPLNMRFDPGQGLTASDIVNSFSDSAVHRSKSPYRYHRGACPLGRASFRRQACQNSPCHKNLYGASHRGQQ
jgi:16S rRNA (cytosine1402-N4)-methyltransferase